MEAADLPEDGYPDDDVWSGDDSEEEGKGTGEAQAQCEPQGWSRSEAALLVEVR